MSLIITLELSSALESIIRQSMKLHDVEQARFLLADALLPTVEELLEQESLVPAANGEWEALADQLIEELAISLPANSPPLTDYAVGRTGV